MEKQKIYFPNLNGIRFIAAFLVIIHHIEQIKLMFHLDNYWEVPFVRVIGKLGVVLFFVLSGFLITYLLLAEEQVFKTINIRKFYIRRMLRIWPLYFLIVLLALFIFPNINLFIWPDYGKEVIYQNLPLKVILFAVFLPNLVLAMLGKIPYASHIWSIGTEEQFYLVWPILLRYFKRNRIFLMLSIILFYATVVFILYFNQGVLQRFWSTFRIDCMAIGGIYAILLFRKSPVIKILMNKFLFYSTLVLVILLLAFGVFIPFIHYDFYSVLFGIIILNFAANPAIHISLENKVFNYLGNISYGLYMYHPVGITLALVISLSINRPTNWLIYPLSTLFTIILAALSYTYFEAFFLRFKDRFSRILSGNTVKDSSTEKVPTMVKDTNTEKDSTVEKVRVYKSLL